MLKNTEDARIEKKDGGVLGPYKAIFAGNTILILDQSADLIEGDVVLRKLPNGRDERSIVTEATFFNRGPTGMGAHYQIKFQKGGQSDMQKPSQTINIHNAQSVQVGDFNTQNILNSIDALKSKIESSNASEPEKAEAKGLLSKALEHPLTVSILGAVAGSIV